MKTVQFEKESKLKQMEKEAFSNCEELVSFSIPGMLEEWDSETIKGCNKLNEIKIDSNNKYDENAIKLFQNGIHLGYIHKNYIQEMVLSYNKKEDYKIELILNKLDIENEELGFQIGFYQRYNSKSFNILNRFIIKCDSIENKYYNLRKNKRLNQYYIEENKYNLKSEEANKIKFYIDNSAFVLLKGKKEGIEVLIVI